MGISVPKLEIKYLLQTDFFFYCMNTNTKRGSDMSSFICDCTFFFQVFSKVLKKHT